MKIAWEKFTRNGVTVADYGISEPPMTALTPDLDLALSTYQETTYWTTIPTNMNNKGFGPGWARFLTLELISGPGWARF